MLKIKLMFFILLITSIAIAHPWKAEHYIIVDTDCGIDDFRAINMLLATPSVRILAITTSNGVLSAEEGFYKVRSLLDEYSHEGILVGASREIKVKAENCEKALKFRWGKEIKRSNNIPSHLDIINMVLENTNENITFICLGSLNTIISASEHSPLLIEQLDNIVWMADIDSLSECFNNNLDPKAYELIEKKKLPCSVVNKDIFGLNYENDLLNEINQIQNAYSHNFVRSTTNVGSPYSNRWCDEIAVIFLHDPELFSVDSISPTISNYKITSLKGVSHLEHSFIEILSGINTISTQVLSAFSYDTSNYLPDIQEMIQETILKYGRDEWVACVLANELHRHLGVYNIIGAKMGVRAKEYFGAGIDELQIISYAGNTPPVSCMNDGLQVSTGATMGHGLISIYHDSLIFPRADFIYMNQKITISLKETYCEVIKTEINKLHQIYGLDSDIYWKEVRKLAINYWNNWDRHEIFAIYKRTLLISE